MTPSILTARVPPRARPGGVPVSRPSLRATHSSHKAPIRGHDGLVVYRQRNNVVVFFGDLKSREAEFPLGISKTPRLAVKSESGLSCSVCRANGSPSDHSKTQHFSNALHVREQFTTWSRNTCSTDQKSFSVKQ